MQPYKIPQNVQIEDKIFGNILTLKQLLIVGIGGAISYIIYTLFVRVYIINSVEIGLMLIPGALGLAFAFIKINDISLFKYCLLFLEFIVKPQKRMWDRKGVLYLSLKSGLGKPIIVKSPAETKVLSKTETLSKLEELTKALDTK